MRTRLLAALVATAISVLSCIPAIATRLPPEIRKSVLEVYTKGTVRLDGSVALPDGNFLLPLIPGVNPLRKIKGEDLQKFPGNTSEPDLLIYENGWAHLKTLHKGTVLTVSIPGDVPEPVKKRLLAMKLPSDLIVPDGFVIPKSLKAILGDLNVPQIDDATLAKPDFGQKKPENSQAVYSGAGTFALISIKDGTIILIDAKTFNKLAEFPTEGTPWGMTFFKGRLFITDQAKNRILLLDPVERKFLGQFDLPPATAPKGIAVLPSSKSLYVSQSGSATVGIYDAADGKAVSKTKVPTGPSRVVLTPDGIYALVISVTASELSLISTYNQHVIGSVKVGSVPTCVALHPTEKLAYVSNRMSNTVSVVDFTKRAISGTIKTGTSPTGLAISPDGSKLYVALGRDNTITVYDTKTLEKKNEVKLPLDVDFPGTICLSPDGKNLLITSQQTDTIGILDTETYEFKKQVQVGHTTQEIIWLPAG
ncbi:MAG: beta-propeller fold lactonase family protein [Candidatus Obscuribacterales bacterium]|nr:beta-propeller fold lactonase family protein [Candidatus Obscuribacterales bacterium]